MENATVSLWYVGVADLALHISLPRAGATAAGTRGVSHVTITITIAATPRQHRMGHQGTLHQYAALLTAFEFGCGPFEHAVVFIGGLGDGLLTVPYVPRLAAAVTAASGGRWSLVQALITSSYSGWGTGSLARDVRELQLLVRYLRQQCHYRLIVLMGHLTGCQDSMRYITTVGDVDAAVLQAPVSDSEGFALQFASRAEFDEMLATVKTEYIDAGRANEILPQRFRDKFWGCPMSAYRYHSLASARGDDDYFSSYLTADDHAQTFGKVATRLLVLYGEKDEFVPASVDKSRLLAQWQAATPPQHWSSHSKILAGATHNVGPHSDPGAEQDLIDTVVRFVQESTRQ